MFDSLIFLFSMALLVLFVFLFRKSSLSVSQALTYTERKHRAEQVLGAAFIKAAITQYELRNTKPSAITAHKFEEAAEEMDDLVEYYYLFLQEGSEGQGNIVKLAKQLPITS